MDSPLVNRIFRRLFAHETCSALRYTRARPTCGRIAATQCRLHERRTFFGIPEIKESSRYSSPKQHKGKDDDWQQRAVLTFEDKTDEYNNAVLVTSEELQSRKTRPKGVKMLTRDFIEGKTFANCLPMRIKANGAREAVNVNSIFQC
jgi:hypothetical protein